MQDTNKKKEYTKPRIQPLNREAVVNMVIRRLTLMNRLLPEFRDVWAIFYQRLTDGCEPLDVLHLINRYALGVCLRAALDQRLESEEDDAKRAM